jgi:beta-lactamase superfamily II metal-dependent hydrolase
MPDPARVFFLDMGREPYGECILYSQAGKTVLIDGGHPGDYDGQEDTPSIPEQLEKVLGKRRPFHVSLLVVTHCHNDHIGCLPEMVENGDLRADWALVADDKIGFGRGVDDDAGEAKRDAADPVRAVAAALLQEDHSDLAPDALARFIDAAARVEDRYREMLDALERNGTRIVRFGRDRDGEAALVKAFKGIGLEILGPSEEQLLVCAETIARYRKDAIARVEAIRLRDASRSTADVYRTALARVGNQDLVDRAGKGAAINDTSIVLRLGPSGKGVLLAGDMQLADAEVPGLDDTMSALVERIRKRRPYAMVKTSHHTSYNAVNADVLDALGAKVYVHCGGLDDPGHPQESALAELDKRDGITFVRTDRNGKVTFDLKDGVSFERGDENDFSKNRKRDLPAVRQPESPEQAVVRAQPIGAPPPPRNEETFTSTVRVPFAGRDVVLTFEIASRPMADGGNGARGRSGASLASRSPGAQVPGRGHGGRAGDPAALAGGRELPKLLFVTNRNELAANIGRAECEEALALVRTGGGRLVEVASDRRAFEQVREALEPGTEGIVILGGYDVVPPQRLDVLTEELRGHLAARTREDDDRFVVWNDDVYGDRDGDGLAELPVSRIPDGLSASVVMASLRASPNGARSRHGIRNQERPFAESVFAAIDGDGKLRISGPETTRDVSPPDLAVDRLYLMLHGSNKDTSRFWGEGDEGTVEALHVTQLPPRFGGVAFAGCCWGALTCQELAYKDGPPSPRGMKSSLALSMLAAGAVAFVGCTGAHYSPDGDGDYAGAPLHAAFWDALVQRGLPPARALFEAKREYVRAMPHDRTDAFEVAVERKIMNVFTCLGLGW